MSTHTDRPACWVCGSRNYEPCTYSNGEPMPHWHTTRGLVHNRMHPAPTYTHTGFEAGAL